MYSAELLIVISTVLGCCSGLICPERCRCEDSPPYIANCSKSGLADIPERFPYQSTLIDLSFNRITYLKEDLLGTTIGHHSQPAAAQLIQQPRYVKEEIERILVFSTGQQISKFNINIQGLFENPKMEGLLFISPSYFTSNMNA